MTDDHNGLPVLGGLGHLAEAVRAHAAGQGLYLRWSRGPAFDAGTTSRDALTGVTLPGLSASPLHVGSWWGDRSLRLWGGAQALRLQAPAGAAARPGRPRWLLAGREVARGPDKEPLVAPERAIAFVAEEALRRGDGW
ncbi:DUF6098 family protein [Saccharopolyspora erythraea]|uniref:DUF6098 family protein n=1 Tax=Saccharopolyspora erythraea TaxID=1836 RepID=UPI002011DA2B|nr:DUF6098 family protein [Saccharopolyspora erythraea]